MDNEIICVYQDCIMCGDRGKKLKKLIFDKGLNVRKVSFASEEGKNLVHEAVFKHKIGSMPFFTSCPTLIKLSTSERSVPYLEPY